jgi:catalase
MSKLALRSFSLLACIGMSFSLGAARAQEGPGAETVVGALEKISGVHKGLRRNHAKGVCASGFFQASEAARALSASTLFSGQTIPVIARFSVAGPNPDISDKARNPRGMALQFSLPDGNLHNMAMLNVPVFAAATVESFYQQLLTAVPDPATGKPDPEKRKAYLAKYPDSKPLIDWLGGHNPPPSYAETNYYSLHAFKFINADKEAHWVKWRFDARDGEKGLTDEELAAAPKDFLAERLSERMKQGPALWDMIVILGEKDDPIDNPTLAWPATRREIKVGTLTLNKAGADATGLCEDINFDPNLVSAGVETSPDPILAFRSSAYAVSYGKRLDEKAN